MNGKKLAIDVLSAFHQADIAKHLISEKSPLFKKEKNKNEKRRKVKLKNPALRVLYYTIERRWMLSPMDLESCDRCVESSQAKDAMVAHTNISEAPWFTIKADNKKRDRLNCIDHFLSKILFIDMNPEPLELPPRKPADDSVRPPRNEQFF
jgi:Polyphosphate kinase 2 (PPK2)